MGLFIHNVEFEKILNKTNSNPIQGNKPMKNIILTIVAALAVNFSALAANIGVDTISSYGGTWGNTDPANSPFSNWDLWTSGNAGHYIGSPAAGMANLGPSFALWGNFTAGTPGFSGYANAQRTFDGGALTAGQSFKVSLATAWRAGSKGIDLYDSSWNNLFNFNVTNDEYRVGGTALSWAYGADSRWDITATQVNSTQIQVNIVRGTDSYTSGLINGSLNAFKVYAGDLGGNEGQRNLYVNNLEIIPEPSSSLLMGLGLAGLAVLRRTRKNA